MIKHKEEGIMKISKKKIEELREFLSRGCEYAGTQDIVNEIKVETLEAMGCDYSPDEVGLEWNGEMFGVVDDFADLFWDKAVEAFLNILSTEE